MTTEAENKTRGQDETRAITSKTREQEVDDRDRKNKMRGQDESDDKQDQMTRGGRQKQNKTRREGKTRRER